MTRTFPGSAQPLGAPAGIPEEYRIPDDLGKDYPINGRAVRLYGIGDVARLLNRKPGTIRKWERDGVIPKATYVKPGVNQDPRGRRRLYTKPQFEALLRVAGEEKILYSLNLQISRTDFKRKIFAAFKELQ